MLLDIGGDVGALILTMPATMEGIEIEIRPAHGDGTPHSHGGPDHQHSHAEGHSHHHHPHVAVVARPTARGPAYTAVFPELVQGSYELYEKLGGPVMMTADVAGGRVAQVSWPV